MTDDFQKDALREREEWLTAMGTSENDVHEDPITSLEFIFIQAEGGEALTRVWLPFTLQSKTIYNSQVIKVRN